MPAYKDAKKKSWPAKCAACGWKNPKARTRSWRFWKTPKQAQFAMSDIRVKICGLGAAEDVDACVEAGAAYVGLVFFPKSPRHLSNQAAKALAVQVPLCSCMGVNRRNVSRK